jgi:Zn finger protein HypA/HybF involved in hydrogenase expression
VSDATAAGTESRKRQYPCPGCGASLEYSPASTELACPFCGRREQIAQTAEQVRELSYAEYLRSEHVPVAKVAQKQVRCDGCAAVTVTAELARSCPFCGSALVVEVEAKELIVPGGVLPFVVTRVQAIEKVQKWISSLWFAPNALKKLAAHEGIRGVYVPYWTFDTNTRTFYSGARGEHYWVNESYTQMVNGKPEQRTRRVRHTRWYPTSGTVERWFDDLLVPATKTVSPTELRSLEPWDLASLCPYESSYLAGFDALRYELDLEPGFESAKEIMKPTLLSDCRRAIGGDEQRVESTRTQ